jgi:hypothetical protein
MTRGLRASQEPSVGGGCDEASPREKVRGGELVATRASGSRAPVAGGSTAASTRHADLPTASEEPNG